MLSAQHFLKKLEELDLIIGCPKKQLDSRDYVTNEGLSRKGSRQEVCMHAVPGVALGSCSAGV